MYMLIIVDMKDDTVPSNNSGVTNSSCGESSVTTAGGIVIRTSTCIQKVVLNFGAKKVIM